MPTFVKRSFAGGELSPSLHARADVSKYQNGLSTCRNFIIKRSGGVATRPGTKFIGPAKYYDKPVRLIPFVFNSSQAYVIEIGHQYIRIIDGDSYLTDATPATISSITKADPAVVTTSAAHGFSNGQMVYIYRDPTVAKASIGMKQMEGRYVEVANVASTTFECLEPYGSVNIDSTGFDTYTASSGLCNNILELTTSYSADDIFDITYAQSGDIVTLCHPGYEVSELRRTGANSWTFTEKIFTNDTDDKSSIVIGTGHDLNSSSTEVEWRYAVTTVSDDGEESTKAETLYQPIRYPRDSDGICQSQTLGGAGPATINGALTSSGVFDTSSGVTVGSWSASDVGGWGRKLIVLVDNNGTDVDVRIYGETNDDQHTTEVISHTGLASLYVESLYYWKYIDRIFVGGAVANDFTVGVLEGPDHFPCRVAFSNPNTPNETRCRIYRGYSNGNNYGLIYEGIIEDQHGTTSGFYYIDDGASPDYSISPPYYPDFFGDVTAGTGTTGGEADKRPGAVCYYQQRLVLAGSNDAPETVWMSRTGFYDNYLISTPQQSDNAIEFTPSNQRLARVRHMLDLGRLILFTEEGEIIVEGDAAGVVTPTGINARKFSYNGIGSLPPLPVGGNALYVQSRGNQVRDIAYNFQTDGYSGNDLTVFAGHLFEKFTITDWTYQRVPDSIIWAVRSDGTLLGLTYLQDHGIWGWHRHDSIGTDQFFFDANSPTGDNHQTKVKTGAYLSVCSIPGTKQDDVYVAVRRDDGPEGMQVYIEKFANRYQEEIDDHVCADCSTVYDGKNTDSDATVYLFGTVWTAGSSVAVVRSNSSFGLVSDYLAEIGDKVRITHNGSSVSVTLTAVSDSSCLGTLDTDAPSALQSMSDTSTGGSTSDWGVSKNSIWGLNHLNGSDVSVQGDGYIIGSPYDSSVTTRTVSDGELSLGDYYEKVHVGLAFISDIKTLDLDFPDAQFVDQKKLITSVTVGLEQTAKLYVGSDAPSDDDVDPLENLSAMDVDEEAGSGGPSDAQLRLRDKNEDVQIDSCWNDRGRVFIRNIDPVPATILAVSPQVLVRQRKGRQNG